MKYTNLKSTLIAGAAICLASEALATEWNVSLWGKRRAFTEHIEKLSELVAERTNGDFTLNISYGGLSNNKENLDGISIGAFEMAQTCTAYHPEKTPTLTVLELPFLGINSAKGAAKASSAIAKHPAVIADMARWNATLFMFTPLPQFNIMGTGDVPKTLEDLKNMSVRATGGVGQALSALGAVPTSMTATEVRLSLDSGVIKAATFAPHAHMAYGVTEVATWWTTNFDPGTLNCPVVVNSDALAALSENERKVLFGAVDEAMIHYYDFYENNTMARWWPLLKENKITKITFSDEDLKSLRKRVAVPSHQAWLKASKARGIPGQELYDLVVEAVTK